jgi:1,2-diacylglycerol 3-alpha-glucosyltransferase
MHNSDSKLKIVFVTDTYDSGNNGTSASARRTAEHLRQRGHEVRVVSTGRPEKDKYLVPVKAIPLVSQVAGKQDFTFAQPVRNTLKKAFSGANIVHLYLPLPLEIEASEIAREMGIPCSAAFHLQPENITYNIHQENNEILVDYIYRKFYRDFYCAFNHIHCPSVFVARQLKQHQYAAKMHVISNGIPSAFQPASQGSVRDKGTFHILSIGRMSPEKKQGILIEAVNRSRYRDRIQLHFAGNGPCKNYLIKQGSSLPNPPTFGFYNQNDLIALMQTCDLYVHPSDVEIEAISCVEAIACGLVPVISNSRKSATPLFALDPRSLFEAGNVVDLANRLDYWIGNNAERARMSQAYAQSAVAYRLDNCLDKMEAMFQEVIQNGGR